MVLAYPCVLQTHSRHENGKNGKSYGKPSAEAPRPRDASRGVDQPLAAFLGSLHHSIQSAVTARRFSLFRIRPTKVTALCIELHLKRQLSGPELGRRRKAFAGTEIEENRKIQAIRLSRKIYRSFERPIITNNPLKIIIPSTAAQHGGGTAQHGAKHSLTGETRHGTTSRPAPSFPPSSSSHSCAVLRHHHQVQVFTHPPTPSKDNSKHPRTHAALSSQHSRPFEVRYTAFA